MLVMVSTVPKLWQLILLQLLLNLSAVAATPWMMMVLMMRHLRM